MDNFVNNRGKKNNNKRELCLFYSTIITFEKLLFAKQNIRTLIIIGQKDINSFSAISELVQLQELWIVECGIKSVPSFKENCSLKKLYLYSNEICFIPNLEACTHLTDLYLSGNNINKLENLKTLTWLQELNLADNKLKRINKLCWRKSELQCLNLAGNPLCFIRDVRYLSQLQKLNSLAFADPLYGDCPLVNMCNYRMHVIHYLPHLKKLDHYRVHEKERHWINYFFKKQMTYYNVSFHKQLSALFNLLKDQCKEYERKMLSSKSQLYAIELQKNNENYSKDVEFDDSKQSIRTRMKQRKRQLKEIGEMIFMQTKILQHQLLININYCGNINFVEYNTASENTVIDLCKQFLQASLCSVMKEDIGIVDLKLHKMTKVSNKEIDQLNDCKNENIENLQSDECSMILKIVALPGVTDIQKWPFHFLQTDIFLEEEIIVTNCLAAADFHWLSNVFLTKNRNTLNDCNACEKRRVCVLVQTPIFNSTEKTNNVNDCLHLKHADLENDSNEICQTCELMNTAIKNPMFVIEYEYVLRESTKKEDDYKDANIACIFDDPVSMFMSHSNIIEYINLDQKIGVHNLVKVCISGQNISSIDTDLELPNLREFDISYNRLKEFPQLCFIRNVQILNISFNDIELLCITESLSKLEELDISWNLLTYCLRTINTFATCIPNMNKLKIYNNPFNDVADPHLAEYLMHLHLPKLQCINNCKRDNLSLPQSYFPCPFNMCKLNNRRRNKLIYLKRSSLKNLEQLKVLEKKSVAQAKYIHVSQDLIVASNVLRGVKHVQELCATCCLLTTFPFAKPLNHLIKLNLGNNLISVLNDFTQKNLPVLKYLDLTNNLITSLEPMGSFHTLQELYCGNNEIKDIVQIDNVKTWQVLRVIDFYNNPISSSTLYKMFIVFHVSNIEYISGEYVRNSDIFEASHIFGNKLDKYVLNTIYETDRLANITQLSLVDCSLSKVDISADVLPQLESLDLSKNRITYLWGLHSFKHLRTLCLSYNRLESLNGNDHEKDKCTFPKLHTLFLDHNCIKSVIDITEQKLPLIKHLFLNGNQLQNINEITHCSTLESLILDSNEIEVLNVEDFTEDNNLKFLSLENNKLKSLKFIKSLKKLKKLYVAHNCLTDEVEIQYLSLLKNLEETTFEGNPLYSETNGNKIIIQDFGVKDTEAEET